MPPVLAMRLHRSFEDKLFAFGTLFPTLHSFVAAPFERFAQFLLIITSRSSVPLNVRSRHLWESVKRYLGVGSIHCGRQIKLMVDAGLAIPNLSPIHLRSEDKSWPVQFIVVL